MTYPPAPPIERPPLGLHTSHDDVGGEGEGQIFEPRRADLLRYDLIENCGNGLAKDPHHDEPHTSPRRSRSKKPKEVTKTWSMDHPRKLDWTNSPSREGSPSVSAAPPRKPQPPASGGASQLKHEDVKSHSPSILVAVPIHFPVPETSAPSISMAASNVPRATTNSVFPLNDSRD